MSPKIRFAFLALLPIVILGSCNKDDTLPTAFTAKPATQVTSQSAILNGDLFLGDNGLTDCGFVYSTVSSKTASGYTTVSLGVPQNSGSFSFQLDGLTPGTTYYFRGFVRGEKSGLYTRELDFTTEEVP